MNQRNLFDWRMVLAVFKSQPLMFAPESGNMMGGMMVNVTGPCFSPTQKIICRFDTQDTVGTYINQNRAVCIMPRVYATGYVDLSISIGGENFNWKGRFYVGNYLSSTYAIHGIHGRILVTSWWHCPRSVLASDWITRGISNASDLSSRWLISWIFSIFTDCNQISCLGHSLLFLAAV